MIVTLGDGKSCRPPAAGGGTHTTAISRKKSVTYADDNHSSLTEYLTPPEIPWKAPSMDSISKTSKSVKSPGPSMGAFSSVIGRESKLSALTEPTLSSTSGDNVFASIRNLSLINRDGIPMQHIGQGGGHRNPVSEYHEPGTEGRPKSNFKSRFTLVERSPRLSAMPGGHDGEFVNSLKELRKVQRGIWQRNRDLIHASKYIGVFFIALR